MIRSPASASASMARYRGSKMCSGRNTFGKSTTFGSGKIGIVGGSIERGGSYRPAGGGAIRYGLSEVKPVRRKWRNLAQWIVLVLRFM